MKYVLSALLCLSFFVTKAQKAIKLEEIGNHVGDSVSVIGKVYTTRYFEDATDAPTLMNLGAAHPNQLLTVVIFGEDRKNFPAAPEKTYNEAVVSVAGTVELYKGKPQIRVRNEKQITVVGMMYEERKKD